MDFSSNLSTISSEKSTSNQPYNSAQSGLKTLSAKLVSSNKQVKSVHSSNIATNLSPSTFISLNSIGNDFGSLRYLSNHPLFFNIEIRSSV